jgi:hypothetical protein
METEIFVVDWYPKVNATVPITVTEISVSLFTQIDCVKLKQQTKNIIIAKWEKNRFESYLCRQYLLLFFLR